MNKFITITIATTLAILLSVSLITFTKTDFTKTEFTELQEQLQTVQQELTVNTNKTCESTSYYDSRLEECVCKKRTVLMAGLLQFFLGFFGGWGIRYAYMMTPFTVSLVLAISTFVLLCCTGCIFCYSAITDGKSIPWTTICFGVLTLVVILTNFIFNTYWLIKLIINDTMSDDHCYLQQ